MEQVKQLKKMRDDALERLQSNPDYKLATSLDALIKEFEGAFPQSDIADTKAADTIENIEIGLPEDSCTQETMDSAALLSTEEPLSPMNFDELEKELENGLATFETETDIDSADKPVPDVPLN